MLRAHLTDSLEKRRDYPITIFHASGIRLQRHVIGEIVEAERTSAGTPLTVASDGDDERAVRGIE